MRRDMENKFLLVSILHRKEFSLMLLPRLLPLFEMLLLLKEVLSLALNSSGAHRGGLIS